MKTTDIRATPVNIPFVAPYRYALGSFAGVTHTIVESDEGITRVRRMRRRRPRRAHGATPLRALLGLDPRDLNQCERRCVPDRLWTLWDDMVALRRGFGAIEMALRDLRGRAEGRLLYQLLGGAVRREIAFTEYFAFRHPRNGKWWRVNTPRHRQPLRTDGRGVRLALLRGKDGNAATRRRDPDGARSATGNRRGAHAPTFQELARLRPYTSSSFSAHYPDGSLLELISYGGRSVS